MQAQMRDELVEEVLGLQGMNYEWDEVAHAGDYLDDGWVLEQKFDGVRVLLKAWHDEHGGTWLACHGGGGELRHSASLLLLPALRPDFERLLGLIGPGEALVLDGELLADGRYVVFDLPLFRHHGIGGQVDDETPQAARRDLLEALHEGWAPSDRVVLARECRTPEEKVRLMRLVAEAEGEGVVAKRVDAPYAAGCRVRDVVKLKFTKTVDAVVMARDVGGKNAHLGLYGGGELRQVGAG
jgi:ATP-dependent DNA ligase